METSWKLKVKGTFRDKYDHVTVYEPGQILEVEDKERAKSLVDRGLCVKYGGKEAASVTLAKVEEAEDAGAAAASPETVAEQDAGAAAASPKPAKKSDNA